MMAVCFLSAFLYFFVKVTLSKNFLLRDIFILNILIFFSFLTFYGTVFSLATFYLYLLIKKQFRLFFYSLPGFVLAFGIDLPLFLQQLHNSHVALYQVANWKSVLGKASLQNLFLIFVKFITGKISFFPKVLYFSLAVLSSIAVYFFALKGYKKNLVFLFLFFVPIVLGLIFSFISPLLQYFRFIYLILPLSLCIALGAKLKWQQVSLVIVFSLWSLAYLAFPQFHREDWRSMAASLPQSTVYAVPSSMDTLRYYKQVAVVDIRNMNPATKEVVIIPYTTDIYGFDYKADLLKKGYFIKTQKNFRGVGYEVWGK
jgi:hypothetical protein